MSAGIATLHAELRAALLAGADTSAIRARIASAEAEQAAAAARLLEQRAIDDAARDARIRLAAEAVAAAAANRLIDRLTALAPPPSPAPKPWGLP